ncbi:hypothetical protein BDN72DRAFT_210450 [Pluteus cervinus]|uniref:Uncharacterized protein n=1 Tax=Pluteus cervinus TaxID=181527 RepID=A0ACD3AHB6_9AGAR|nr:hypothetical protein BDN72DRAFT_210450 [Pluteus cervinus]
MLFLHTGRFSLFSLALLSRHLYTTLHHSPLSFTIFLSYPTCISVTRYHIFMYRVSSFESSLLTNGSNPSYTCPCLLPTLLDLYVVVEALN